MLPGPARHRRSGGARPSRRHRRTTTPTTPRANRAEQQSQWKALLQTRGAFTMCMAILRNGQRTAGRARTGALLPNVSKPVITVMVVPEYQMNAARELLEAAPGATIHPISAPPVAGSPPQTTATLASAFVLPEHLPLEPMSRPALVGRDLQSRSLRGRHNPLLWSLTCSSGDAISKGCPP
jgi:hypothetical protein